jgi:hypothetical protein
MGKKGTTAGKMEDRKEEREGGKKEQGRIQHVEKGTIIDVPL